MDLTLNLGTIVQLVIAGVLGQAVRTLAGLVSEMKGMQVWREAHEKSDDERHDKTGDELASIWRKIEK